jgi:hypothetical protein
MYVVPSSISHPLSVYQQEHQRIDAQLFSQSTLLATGTCITHYPQMLSSVENAEQC